jgi:hypothetical protein
MKQLGLSHIMLPACLPAAAVLVYVLQGAGTIAHLIHTLYPERQMHGWELDRAVVAVAQQHMGLAALQEAGCLVSTHMACGHSSGGYHLPQEQLMRSHLRAVGV